MGLAIFWIFFYHTGIELPVLRELFSLGWIGVDIFFFISGFGLCASLTKDNSVKGFFKRRFKRIIPTWWIVLAVMAIFGFCLELRNFPSSPIDFFYWFTGIGWWTANCNFEWYIPTLLLFYLFSPLLARMSVKSLCVIALVSATVAILLGGGILRLFDHIYMSYSRIPVFISGFAAYKFQRSKTCVSSKLWIPVCFFGLIWFGAGMFVKTYNVTFGLTIARVAIPMFIIPMLALIAIIFSKISFINSLMSFLGLISLEVYLLHINHEFSHSVETMYLSVVDNSLIKLTWFAIVVTTAWMLHNLMQKTSQLFGND